MFIALLQGGTQPLNISDYIGALVAQATAQVRALYIIHPFEVIQISSLTEEGIDAWCNWLIEKVKQKQQA